MVGIVVGAAGCIGIAVGLVGIVVVADNLVVVVDSLVVVVVVVVDSPVVVGSPGVVDSLVGQDRLVVVEVGGLLLLLMRVWLVDSLWKVVDYYGLLNGFVFLYGYYPDTSGPGHGW